MVAVIVGKTVGNIHLAGVFRFIPALNYLPYDGKGLSQAVDTAAAMMLEEDEALNDQVQGVHRNYGTAAAPMDLRKRMIAEGVMKDLICELGEAVFKKQIGLRKVLLRRTAHSHVGSSATQAQSVEAQSEAQSSVSRSAIIVTNATGTGLGARAIS
ncbi:unnamed protein product [Calypogeia fissa]